MLSITNQDGSTWSFQADPSRAGIALGPIAQSLERDSIQRLKSVEMPSFSLPPSRITAEEKFDLTK